MNVSNQPFIVKSIKRGVICHFSVTYFAICLIQRIYVVITSQTCFSDEVCYEVVGRQTRTSTLSFESTKRQE